MTDRKTTFAGRLAQLVRLLNSPSDGETLAAARSLGRVLSSNGHDFNWLAKTIEHLNGKTLSEPEMKTLYDAGYQDGLRAAVNKQQGSLDFRGVDGDVDWHEVALWCQKRDDRDDRLSDREREFVDTVAAQTVYREPSVKQARWLKSIFLRLGGQF